MVLVLSPREDPGHRNSDLRLKERLPTTAMSHRRGQDHHRVTLPWLRAC